MHVRVVCVIHVCVVCVVPACVCGVCGALTRQETSTTQTRQGYGGAQALDSKTTRQQDHKSFVTHIQESCPCDCHSHECGKFTHMEGAQVPDSKTPLDLYTYDTHAFDLDDYEMKFMAPFCHSFWEVECLAPPRLSIRCPPLLSSLCLSLYAVVASPLVSIPHLLPHLCYKSLPPPPSLNPRLPSLMQ